MPDDVFWFHVEQIIISSGVCEINHRFEEPVTASLDALFCTFNQILGRGLQR